jgi:ribosomal protein S1
MSVCVCHHNYALHRGVISDIITKGSGGCWVDISHDVRGFVPLLEMSDKPDVLQHTNTRLVILVVDLRTNTCMLLH